MTLDWGSPSGEEKGAPVVRNFSDGTTRERNPSTGVWEIVTHAAPKAEPSTTSQWGRATDPQTGDIYRVNEATGEKEKMFAGAPKPQDPNADLKALYERYQYEDALAKRQIAGQLEAGQIDLANAKLRYQAERDRLAAELDIRAQELTQRGQDMSMATSLGNTATNASMDALNFVAPKGMTQAIATAAGGGGWNPPQAPPFPFDPAKIGADAAMRVLNGGQMPQVSPVTMPSFQAPQQAYPPQAPPFQMPQQAQPQAQPVRQPTNMGAAPGNPYGP